jgi:beta-phosphoglucomutase-like phosphatase (HAD superfamily)
MSLARPRLTTIVFDFDGVIADTEQLHLRAYKEVFGARGWTLSDAVYFDRYLGYDDEGMIKAFSADENLGLGEADVSELVDVKGEAFGRYLANGDVLFPDAPACIGRLATRYRLGIASGALKEEIRHILRAADLIQHFPVIVASEDVSACKPDPEPYLTAARQLGVLPSECLAIEDSPPGLDAARAAGMRTIGVTTTVARDQLKAHRVVDRLDEITLELLQQLD